MNDVQYKAAMEALLFASGEPMAAQRIGEVLGLDPETTVAILKELMQDINGRDGGIMMVKLGEEYQLCTRPAYAEYIRKAMDIRRDTPLSSAAMEVLAIVAYNQPVTRAFIEQVRGVDCSAVIQGLVQKQLIEEKGRLELPGRPLLYGTTANFLRCFGLSSLEELPPLPKDGEVPSLDQATLEDVLAQNNWAEPTLEDLVAETEQAMQ